MGLVKVALAAALALATLAGNLPASQAGPTCTPLTKCWASNQCGTQGNGCGGQLQCGKCPAGRICKSNKCVPDDGLVGACQCGNRTDASGKVVRCGTCAAGLRCQNNKCVTCRPLTRCWVSNQCGTQGDGCGGKLICGKCAAGKFCKANKCVPEDGANIGDCQCGTTLNDYDEEVDCGTCATGQRCQDNKCVACTPLTQCWAGFECGIQGNGCGGSIRCGTCPAGKTCQRYKCVDTSCTPLTKCSDGNVCGTQANGCGGTLNCGTCPSGTTCQNNKCVSSCTPLTQCSTANKCGTQSNGCGGTLNCGTCPAGYACTGGRCCWDTCTTCGRNSDQCGGSFDCACPKGPRGEEFVCTEDAFGQMDEITCIRTEACLCFNQPRGAPECTDLTTQSDTTARDLQSCVSKVSALQPSCGSGSWTQECRRLAVIACSPLVECPVNRTQNANECLCSEHTVPEPGSLGSLVTCLSNTLNEKCVQAICKKDPACCDSSWDQLCIDAAIEDAECPAVCG